MTNYQKGYEAGLKAVPGSAPMDISFYEARGFNVEWEKGYNDALHGVKKL